MTVGVPLLPRQFGLTEWSFTIGTFQHADVRVVSGLDLTAGTKTASSAFLQGGSWMNRSSVAEVVQLVVTFSENQSAWTRHRAAPRSQCSPVNTGTSIHALHGSLLQRGAGAIPARVVLTVLLFELQIHELAAIRKSWVVQQLTQRAPRAGADSGRWRGYCCGGETRYAPRWRSTGWYQRVLGHPAVRRLITAAVVLHLPSFTDT